MFNLVADIAVSLVYSSSLMKIYCTNDQTPGLLRFGSRGH